MEEAGAQGQVLWAAEQWAELLQQTADLKADERGDALREQSERVKAAVKEVREGR